MARELGKKTRLLSENYFSLRKKHVLAYARATREWGTSNVPILLIDLAHPRGKEARNVLWSKCSDVLKHQILLEDFKDAEFLWSWLQNADSGLW